jgi:hypothetical protein
MATHKGLQLDGYTSTEEEMQKIALIIADDYLTASKEITAKLQAIYAKYLTGIDPDDYYNTLIQYNRLQNMLKEVSDSYLKYSRKAGKEIGKSGELAINNNFYRQYYSLSFIDGPIDLKFGIINPNLVEASVYGTAEAWRKIQSDAFLDRYGNPKLYMRQGTLSETLVKNNAQTLAKLRQTLQTGLLNGDGYRKTARSVREIVGTVQIVDGKKVYTGGLAQAVTLTRTEGTRNLNAGNLASTNDSRAQGLEISRRWDATLDGRTRPAHGKADGQTENKDGLFTVGGEKGPYPGALQSAGNNANCRCTTIDIVDGQSPLGRRGRPPQTAEQRKAGIIPESEVFSYKTYDEYMRSYGMTEDKTGKWVKKESK